MTQNIGWYLISAPEILDKNDYSFASDLWSIGVLLYKLAFGKYPFEGQSIIQYYKNIINNDKEKFEKSGNKEFDDLISKLLNKKKNRITYEEYFKHPFFKFNEPESILNFNEKYNLNISSFNKRIFFQSYTNGNQLLKDLSNIEFVNLKELHLQDCCIDNLEPLTSENFKNLLLLNLQHNKIKNLAPFTKIKFLSINSIALGFNSITNIDVLKEIPFKQLKIISLPENPVLKIDKNYKNIINSIQSK